MALLEVKNLHTYFKTRKGTVKAVNDVSYRRASAKGIQYRWGSVTLSTLYGKYKFGFVADCEEVSKRLTQLVYEEKYRNGEK